MHEIKNSTAHPLLVCKTLLILDWLLRIVQFEVSLLWWGKEFFLFMYQIKKPLKKFIRSDRRYVWNQSRTVLWRRLQAPHGWPSGTPRRCVHVIDLSQRTVEGGPGQPVWREKENLNRNSWKLVNKWLESCQDQVEWILAFHLLDLQAGRTLGIKYICSNCCRELGKL